MWQVFTFTILLVPYSAIVCPVDTYVEEYYHCKQKVLSCESSKVLASTIVPAPRVASGLPNLQDRSAEEMPCVGTQYHLGNPKQHHHRHHHFPHHRYYDYHNFLQCFEEMPCVCRYLGTTRVTLSRGIIVIITIISTIILLSTITTRKFPRWILDTYYQGTTLLTS